MDNDWTAWRERCIAAEAEVAAAEATIARMWEGHAAQTGHYTADDCIRAECEVRGAADCPHGEELHYHHDGCPACDMDDVGDPFDLPMPGPDCSETEHVAGCRHAGKLAGLEE